MGTLDTTKYHSSYESFLTLEECDFLSHIILKYENEILRIPNEFPNGYEDTPLTSQHTVYNWLDHPDVARLQIPQRLFRLPELTHINEMYAQCWCNILRQGQKLNRHNHCDEPTDFYSLNIFIDGNTTTGTHYEDTGRIHNTRGELHIVGTHLEHEVPTHLFQKPRISMAIDLYLPSTHKDIRHQIDSKKVHPNRYKLLRR